MRDEHQNGDSIRKFALSEAVLPVEEDQAENGPVDEEEGDRRR